MTFVNRTIIICAIKNFSAQHKQHLCFIPELIALHFALRRINENQMSLALRNHMHTLREFESHFGAGIIPLKTKEANLFVENVFNEALQNNIPLPVSIMESDLKFHIKNFDNHHSLFQIHEKRIRINHRNLTFFAKYLPYVGTVMTYTLTLGFTLMSYKTLLKWCWSLSLITLFCLSKLLTNYADISGGPERRLQMLGSWIDRLRTNAYQNYAKFSLPLLVLNLCAIAILGCSSILTWYAAWELLCTIKAIAELPSLLSFMGAGVFACFSVGSTFGRIYSDLYQLLYRKSAPYFSFDNVKNENKLDLETLSEKLKTTPSSVEQEIPATAPHQAPLILHQYHHQANALNNEVDNVALQQQLNASRQARM